jgi:hypothetical protein
VLFRRFVVETAIDAEGVLRPVPQAPWRSEPAIGEADLDRRLAALADASPNAISAFASTYGFLRRKVAVLRDLPEPVARGHLQIAGQRGADDMRAVIDWVDAGCPNPPPEGASLAIQAASALPDDLLNATELMMQGAPDAEIEGVLSVDPQVLVPDLMASRLPAAVATPPQSPRTPEERALLRRKLEVLEWVSSIFGGTEEPPAALAGIGGTVGATMSLLTGLPEAFAHPELGNEASRAGSELMAQLAPESIHEWRDAADWIARARESVRLVLRTRRSGLSADEKARLRRLCLELADGYIPPTLTTAELAERAAPLLQTGLEMEMARGGVWPPKSNAIAGAYWRALVVLWSRLTDRRPPSLCASAGCTEMLPARQNRQYCDRHRRTRKRDAMRARRAAKPSASPVDSTASRTAPPPRRAGRV